MVMAQRSSGDGMEELRRSTTAPGSTIGREEKIISTGTVSHTSFFTHRSFNIILFKLLLSISHHKNLCNLFIHVLLSLEKCT